MEVTQSSDILCVISIYVAGYGEMLFFCDFFVVSLIVIDFVLLDFALNYSYSMVLVWNNLHERRVPIVVFLS